MTHRPLLPLAVVAAILAPVLLAPVSCGNNVGALFDPDDDRDGSGDPDGVGNGVQAMRVGGIARDGRPSVTDVFPMGGGWPSTVPIVVVFDESVNEDSVVGPDSGTPGLFVAPSGTMQSLPATYDFLLGGTVVVIRPTGGLLPGPDGVATSFDVVVESELTDVDSIRFATGDTPEIIATFTPDASDTVEDAEILTMLPVDNSVDQFRETPIYAVFTRPANDASITSANFRVRQVGTGVDVSGGFDFPLEVLPMVDDTRVLEFLPDDVLPAGARFEITVDDTITFGTDGVLEFFGRTPFADLRSLGVPAPLSVSIGNATPGFDEAINLGNLANLLIDVDIAPDSQAGDRVVVRLYGLDPATANSSDVNFVERQATVPANGAQTVTVDFGGALGTLATPSFEDGNLIIAVRSERSQTSSGSILSDVDDPPRVDLTPPVLLEIGPPNSGSVTASADLVTDQEFVSFYGTASEQLGAVDWTVGPNSMVLYGSSIDGRFITHPLRVGFSTATGRADYTVAITDLAGNLAGAPLVGQVAQRGVVSGALPGDLVVEAYDEATLAPIPGATVVVEPGMPQQPAVGQITATTGMDGRATFAGLPQTDYTVTIVAGGFQLITLLESQGSFVSLPLAPITNPTASFTGLFSFGVATPAMGVSIAFGSNVFADPTTESVFTNPAMPTVLPPTTVRANRPIVIAAFSGVFPATSIATFGDFGCGLCGVDSITPTPPFPPLDPGDSGGVGLLLIAAEGATGETAGSVAVDFATATGLGPIVGTPSANFMTSLRGIGGMTLSGVGRATLQAGTTYDIDGTYSLRLLQNVTFFSPTTWLSAEAQDAAGNLSRIRALVGDVDAGTLFTLANAPGIPTITDPVGPSTGSPAITFEDRVDASAVPGGFAFFELTAFDPGGRRWTVLGLDGDGAIGPRAVQVPDLSAVSVTGLSTGVWSVEAETFLMVSVAPFTPNGFVLEERFRELVGYAKAQTVAFTIQ